MQIYPSLDDAFFLELKSIWEEGNVVNSRGSIQKELLFRNIKISDPTDLDIASVERKFNSRYATLEFLWYLSRDPSVKNIGKVASLWKDVQDPEGNVESNYGCYIFPNQWNFIIRELSNDIDSRRATIEIAKPEHKTKNLRDVPCAEYIHFFVRDNKLHLGSYMRSNDIILGFCNDVFVFCLLQQMMFNELRGFYPKLQLGNYFHHAWSLHLYERHYDMARSILNKKNKNKRKFKLREDITLDGIVTNSLYLPSREMSREDILGFADKVVLFDQS